MCYIDNITEDKWQSEWVNLLHPTTAATRPLRKIMFLDTAMDCNTDFREYIVLLLAPKITTRFWNVILCDVCLLCCIVYSDPQCSSSVVMYQADTLLLSLSSCIPPPFFGIQQDASLLGGFWIIWMPLFLRSLEMWLVSPLPDLHTDS
jgi:hypothetical protein